MKHIYKLIALLLLLLLVFSITLSPLAEPGTSSDNTTSQENESSDQTQSENTPSNDTSSDNTSSDDTSSDNTSSDDTSSDNTSSEDTSSDNTSSDNTSSDDTSSDNTSSDNTSSDGTSSDNTSSDNTSSENTPPPLTEEELDRLYGTKEDGYILPEGLTMWSVELQSALKNSGFTEGLRYWLSLNGGKPSENVTIVQNGENTYLTANKNSSGDTIGIVSMRFSYKNIVPGQAPVVIYDWAGSNDFTVKLEQRDLAFLYLVSSGFGQSLYTAKNDEEWNTSVTKPLYPVRFSENGYYNINFIVKIEIHNPNADIKLDNLRIGFINANGIVYDVNGNEIKGERRATNEAEPPPVEYIPPVSQNTTTSSNSTSSGNAVEQVIQRGGDNDELINTFIILGTIAICLILALVPSAIVKAAKKNKKH